MSTWNSPPQIPPYKEPPFGATAEQQTEGLTAYLKQLANVVSVLKNDLEFMLNGNLDVKNIRAKGITADRMDVNELSAISANLGHITAGLIEAVQIFGSYIATSQSYPRCEMSNTENLFGAYQSANNYAQLAPINPSYNAPAFFINQGSEFMVMGFGSGLMTNKALYSNGGIEIRSPIGIYLTGRVNINDWSQLYNFTNNRTLQQELQSKLSGNGAYGGFYASSSPGGPADMWVSITNGLISP